MIDMASLATSSTTTNSTRLGLNNLVEFFFPIRTSKHVNVACISSRR